jgi:hypothetical protein
MLSNIFTVVGTATLSRFTIFIVMIKSYHHSAYTMVFQFTLLTLSRLPTETALFSLIELDSYTLLFFRQLMDISEIIRGLKERDRTDSVTVALV